MKTIPLTHGKVAIVDNADYVWLTQWNWAALSPNGRTYYATRGTTVGGKGGKSVRFYMHRVIAGITDPKVLVDHHDRDGLNNRRKNIRVADKSKNGCNRPKQANNKSGVKGVHWDTDRQRWFAKITINRKQIALGRFDKLKDAAEAYRAAAIRLHGDFAAF